MVCARVFQHNSLSMDTETCIELSDEWISTVYIQLQVSQIEHHIFISFTLVGLIDPSLFACVPNESRTIFDSLVIITSLLTSWLTAPKLLLWNQEKTLSWLCVSASIMLNLGRILKFPKFSLGFRHFSAINAKSRADHTQSNGKDHIQLLGLEINVPYSSR